jgi:transposase
MHFLLLLLLLLSTNVSLRTIQRLMSSSGVTYREDHSISIWFITKVLDQAVHINTSGSTGFSDTVCIVHFTQIGLKCFKYYKIIFKLPFVCKLIYVRMEVFNKL